MKKIVKQYRIAKKKQEPKKEEKKDSVQINSYVSYYELFKSISK